MQAQNWGGQYSPHISAHTSAPKFSYNLFPAPTSEPASTNYPPALLPVSSQRLSQLSRQEWCGGIGPGVKEGVGTEVETVEGVEIIEGEGVESKEVTIN